jgi:DNA-directed RNA polymerase II subunit RPB1
MKSASQYKNPSRIIGIQFGMSSPEEIRKAGVVEVVSKDTYINNKEVPGGLFDPRMGVLGPGSICPTDGLTYIQTPGYFGYIEMARPVFFIQHIKEIMKILKCVCFKCSKLLISKEQHTQVYQLNSYHRWDYVYPLCQKVKRCGELTENGCGCKQPDKIKLDGMSTINAIWENLVNEGTGPASANATAAAIATESKDGKSNYTMKLTAEIVLKIFKRISDEDVEFMGFSATWSRPDWMICQVLPVAPPAVRPSVKMDANQRSEDYLTHIYGHIIKTNKDLMERINANASQYIIDNLTMVLQYFVAMIVNNKVKGAVPVAHRTGRPLQCITGRLNSKNGRIRGNLMGKRVDFSARSVITGDPNLSARQLGVPLRVAMCLTKPVVVNDRNRNFLIKLVQNGPEVYPGAKILEKKDGSNVSLRYVDRTSIRLENGDIVHRHMMDGDAVLFNRQPSLHRMSMMCHIVKVMKRGDTFRMNVCDTKPYNADFDGDEMNMHMPQSELSETELRNLAAIPYQIISPSSNAPIIGIFQDSMLGSYQFTRQGVEFTPRQAMNILMGYSNIDMKELRNKKKITNFDILSQITPPISLKYKTKLFDDAEDPNVSNNVLEIHNGKYIRGQADKGVFASGTKGILNRICNDFGNMACSNYIDDLQQVITEYMKTSAYSVGVSDLVSDRKTTESVLQVISSKMNEVAELTDKIHLGILENNSGRTNAQEFEIQVGNILNDATSQTGKIGVKSLDESNRFVKIVKSGSKGSMLNISQMISCLGQQSVDGKRVPYGFDNRTLPHFKKFDDSPEARGFVKNSYISGLTAPELFFHAMGGRMGLIDTAVKTSQTGYIQRRLVKGLEDLKVEYDGTVRNNMGKIVQFTYGEDGVDTTRVENQNIGLVNMSIEDIYMYYDLVGLNEGENKDMLHIYTKETIKRFKTQRDKTKTKCKFYVDELIKFRDELVINVFHYKNEDAIKTPVAFQYIIQNIQGQMNLTATSAVDITPLEFIETIEKTFAKLKSMFKVTRLFEIMFFYSLSPKELLIKKRFNTRAVAVLMEHIVLAYKKSVVHPGEMVGVIAGQSIGEPTTQLTLNSFVYETEILVRNSAGEIMCVQIGDFTKSGIEKSRKLDYMEDKDTTYAELSEFYEVPSATEDGKTVWRRVEAVTKHPVINEDGTNTMLKITTKGCRVLIATKAKSFLKLVDGKIVGVEGKDLSVGDYLPVSKKPLDFTEMKQLDLRDILPPNEYIYGTEMLKAKSVVHEHQWWSKHSGKTFILPYTRSDSAYCALVRPSTSVVYHPGFVYTKTNSICEYKIPEFIELDYDFGYLVGAYCAEGSMTPHQISIANNDDEYLKRIETWCAKHNLTTKVYTQRDKVQDGWTSQDIRIYSTILCNILKNLCGKLSHNKYVSDKIMFSNHECILGFLDAYIGGDGCVKLNKNRIENIEVTSVSFRLLTCVQLMLKNLGILSKINKPKLIESNNLGSVDIKQAYVLTVRNDQSIKLAKMLRLPVKSKRDRIAQLLDQTFKYEYCKFDLTVPNTVDGTTMMEPRNGRCADLEFDKILSIEEVENTTAYAYDLTVEDTRNFDCANGLCVRDTFHLAGVATKSNVTRGVPRIEEILRLTRNPDKPSATIFLKPADQHDKDKAANYCNMIQHTKLVDVVKSVEICFDPNDFDTKFAGDKAAIEEFYEFEKMVEECNDGTDEVVPRSKWIIRIEIDAVSLLDKNITMDDIHFAISNGHKSDVSCVFSDMNANTLLFRIRLNSSVFKKKKGAVESLDQSDEIYLLKNFQDNLLNNVVLRGVNNITNVNPRMVKDMVVKEDSKFVRKDIWLLDTVGSNLLDIFPLDFIDYTRTYSNDIREVYDVLGIEAARQNILNEFNEVMEASDAYVNYHHLSILCDRMTVKAEMVPMFRSGIINDDIGPISKSTYEMHTEIFLDASRHGDFDQMRGVSANVMCGQAGFYGTNAFSLLLDMNAIMKLEEKELAEKKAVDFGFVQEDDTAMKIDIDNNVRNIQSMDIGKIEDDYSLF